MEASDLPAVVALPLLMMACAVTLGLGLCEFTMRVSVRAGRRRAQAEQRAITLLKEWLSPAQRAQYEGDGCFEVIGSHSGKRYRIRRGRQVNIDELGEHGTRVAVLCFLPEGCMPTGDVMLAQKIVLETNEPAALKVAVRTIDGVGAPYILPP